MIGTKAIFSTILVAVGALAAVYLATPARVAGLDASTFFWIGVWSITVGTLVVRFWRIQRPSALGFRYAYGERPWEDEADFLTVGPHRISLVENDGDAFDYPPSLQLAIYIGLAFVVGLLTVDGRAIQLIADLPGKLTAADAQFCPDPDASAAAQGQQSPGCALVRRAYDLGFAKSLGTCDGQAERRQATEVCTRRQRDEPVLHYAWRLLDEFWQSLNDKARADHLAAIDENFTKKLNHLETLFKSQRQIITAGARASHHIWTNVPHPSGEVAQALSDTVSPGSCTQRYRRMPHRPTLREVNQPGHIIDHVLGKLLFEPRYVPPAGFCREYTVHWGADNDICLYIAQDPQQMLQEEGALDDILVLLDRLAVARDLDRINADASMTITFSNATVSPAQRFTSFVCYIEEERDEPTRTTIPFSLDGHEFTIEQLRVPIPAANSHVARYKNLASLLARGFHYGVLMSEASLDLGAGDWGESMFDDSGFLLSQLDFLTDTDIFIGHDWVLARDDLKDVYPYHLHAKNFIQVFRKQYMREKGRL